MPKLGLTMKEGVVARWLKKEGERVAQGEPLLEVETEKILTEIEAPGSGILKILAPEGSNHPVGELIAIIAHPDEELTPSELSRKTESHETPTSKVEGIIEPVTTPIAKQRMRISPLARKLAKQHEIDVTKIEGSEPGGRIGKADILRAIENAKTSFATAEARPDVESVPIAGVVPLTGIRKTTTERLSRSYREAIHVTLATEVDMTELVKLRRRVLTKIEKREKVSIGYTNILVKATAIALEKNPIINSVLEADQIKKLKNINIGVAVASRDGLLVPVVRDPNRKTINEIASLLNDLTEKAKQRHLTLDEVSDGTFTISNLGMFGIDTFEPIINPPQSAILGVGAIKEKPMVIEGQIKIRSTMTLSLVFDHRVYDGVPAAAFLMDIKEILEKPQAHLDIK